MHRMHTSYRTPKGWTGGHAQRKIGVAGQPVLSITRLPDFAVNPGYQFHYLARVQGWPWRQLADGRDSPRGEERAEIAGVAEWDHSQLGAGDSARLARLMARVNGDRELTKGREDVLMWCNWRRRRARNEVMLAGTDYRVDSSYLFLR